MVMLCWLKIKLALLNSLEIFTLICVHFFFFTFFFFFALGFVFQCQQKKNCKIENFFSGNNKWRERERVARKRGERIERERVLNLCEIASKKICKNDNNCGKTFLFLFFYFLFFIFYFFFVMFSNI